jgi:hypothetical protein
MNLHVRGVVHGECNTSLSTWVISRTLRLKLCLKLFLSVKLRVFVSHLFCVRNVCLLTLREVSRGFTEPPRRITMNCLETG